MNFNSLHFALFVTLLFCIYWFLLKNKLKGQNILILLASYFFYSCWDYRFLALIIFSCLLDYFSGLQIAKTENKRTKKTWLIVSIGINLGFLGVFKYYNFFAESLVELSSNLGFKLNLSTLNLILPIGISFYTFHGLSYIIDIYNNKIKEEKNFINYSVFVCFFPLLVAGPIERASHLLPQITNKRTFDYTQAANGLRQILWGLFKKIVIADNCAEYVDLVFSNSSAYPGSALLMASVLFSIQIYCDFSGYSDIALGVSKLFGFELKRNFAYPYFSKNITDFWKRWHISLTSWFKDYVYIPLGGSRNGLLVKIRNVLFIFILSGFWHGANWTFFFWGLMHALLYIYELLMEQQLKLQKFLEKKLISYFKIIYTFGLVTLAWILFRSKNMAQAKEIYGKIFSKSIFESLQFSEQGPTNLLFCIIFLFFLLEWLGKKEQFALENMEQRWISPFKQVIYAAILIAIIFLGGKDHQYIYFQF